MKLALLADLHANREAALAVMQHARAQGAQRFVFLGDYVGYGADPGWVVDMVRDQVAQGAVAVLGNHDLAVVEGPHPAMIAAAREVVGWTRARLGAEQIAFLAARPLSVVESDCLFVHANAAAPAGWRYVQSRSDAGHSLRSGTQTYQFCGHVHLPALCNLHPNGQVGMFTPMPGLPIVLPPQRRWLALPGSAGQPRDGNPAACYASFDTGSATLTFHRVAYDHESAAAKMRAAGLPDVLARRLIDGR